MTKDTKKCKSCNTEFDIADSEKDFCENLKVPVRLRCVECSLVGRMMFRNERYLYNRKESRMGKDVLSIYSSDKNVVVYEQEEWRSDAWDPMEYGRKYDFSRPFFEQFKELFHKIPHGSLNNWDAVRSEYCNWTYGNKDCYLVFGGDFNENCSYSTFNFYSKECSDCYWVNKCELSYECIDSENCYKVRHSQYARNCSDSDFLLNCTGCQNCVGCVNLKNKSYCIFNKQYTKEEYEKKLSDYQLDSYDGIERMKKEFSEFRKRHPRKYAEIIKAENCTGNNINGAKNSKNCFDVFEGAENVSNIFLTSKGVRDSQNSDHFGLNSELCWEASSVYPGNRALFSWIMVNARDIYYSIFCKNVSNVFGCVNVRDKSYCILNKQYTKDEYEEMVPKIISHMKDMPYKDVNGVEYSFGEFFPADISLFAYNETVAQELRPLTKKEAEEKGYRWKEPETNEYDITLKTEDIPQKIIEVDDSITSEIIECAHNGECQEQCTKAFKVTPQEIQLYRKLQLPIPQLCSNCRHYGRIKQRAPMKLWRRKCQCGGVQSESGDYKNTVSHEKHGEENCKNEFETPYSPDKEGIIYCANCYNNEVA